MTRPASATSARSLRKALWLGSGRSDGPESENCSALVGVGRGLADDRPVGGRADVPLPEVALEPFKKVCPAAGSDDEHVPAVVLVSFAAQIAERPERVQGASDHRLGHSEHP